MSSKPHPSWATLAGALIYLSAHTAYTVIFTGVDTKQMTDTVARLLATGRNVISPSVKGPVSTLTNGQGRIAIMPPSTVAAGTSVVISGPTPTFFDHKPLSLANYSTLGACAILALGTTTVIIAKLARMPPQRQPYELRSHRPSLTTSDNGGEDEDYEDDDEDETPSPDQRFNFDDSFSEEDGCGDDDDDDDDEDGSDETQDDIPDNERLNLAGGSGDPPPPPPPPSTGQDDEVPLFFGYKIKDPGDRIMFLLAAYLNWRLYRFLKERIASRSANEVADKVALKTFQIPMCPNEVKFPLSCIGEPTAIPSNICPNVIPLIARVPMVADVLFEEVLTSVIISALDSAVSVSETAVLPLIVNSGIDCVSSSLISSFVVFGLVIFSSLAFASILTFRQAHGEVLPCSTSKVYPRVAAVNEEAHQTFEIPIITITEPGEIQAVSAIDTTDILEVVTDVEPISDSVVEEAGIITNTVGVQFPSPILNEVEVVNAAPEVGGDEALILNVVDVIEILNEVEALGNIPEAEMIDDFQQFEVANDGHELGFFHDFHVPQFIDGVQEDIPEVEVIEYISEVEAVDVGRELDLINEVPEFQIIEDVIEDVQDNEVAIAADAEIAIAARYTQELSEVVNNAREVESKFRVKEPLPTTTLPVDAHNSGLTMVELDGELPKAALNPAAILFVPSPTILLVALGPSSWAPTPPTAPIVPAAPVKRRRRNHRGRGRGSSRQIGEGNIEGSGVAEA